MLTLQPHKSTTLLYVVVSHTEKIYICAGYDGNNRVNDFWQYDTDSDSWSVVDAIVGQPPTPRHSHSGCRAIIIACRQPPVQTCSSVKCACATCFGILKDQPPDPIGCLATASPITEIHGSTFARPLLVSRNSEVKGKPGRQP